jgi:hypothetical protein
LQFIKISDKVVKKGGRFDLSSQKLSKIDEQIAKLKAQKQAILQREQKEERRKRTRRLIQVGAIFEKYLEIDSLESAEAWAQTLTDNAEFYERLKAQAKRKLNEIQSKKIETEEPLNQEETEI